MLPQRKLNFLLNSSDSCTNLQLPIKALISLFLLFSSKIRIIVPLYSAPDPSISPASLQSPLSSITQIGREIRVYRSFVAWFRNLAPHYHAWTTRHIEKFIDSPPRMRAVARRPDFGGQTSKQRVRLRNTRINCVARVYNRVSS